MSRVVAIAAGNGYSLALVADAPALEVRASGNSVLLSWSWRGNIPMEAITEAVHLASELFRNTEGLKPHAHPRRKHLRNLSLAAA